MSELEASSSDETLPPWVPRAGIVVGTGAAEAHSAQQPRPQELGLLHNGGGRYLGTVQSGSAEARLARTCLLAY